MNLNLDAKYMINIYLFYVRRHKYFGATSNDCSTAENLYHHPTLVK
jgi:hypothetical protein